MSSRLGNGAADTEDEKRESAMEERRLRNLWHITQHNLQNNFADNVSLGIWFVVLWRQAGFQDKVCALPDIVFIDLTRGCYCHVWLKLMKELWKRCCSSHRIGC